MRTALCVCRHTLRQHQERKRCRWCGCVEYKPAKPPTTEQKQDIVDELHDALKKPDTVLKLKVPEDEIE